MLDFFRGVLLDRVGFESKKPSVGVFDGLSHDPLEFLTIELDDRAILPYSILKVLSKGLVDVGAADVDPAQAPPQPRIDPDVPAAGAVSAGLGAHHPRPAHFAHALSLWETFEELRSGEGFGAPYQLD